MQRVDTTQKLNQALRGSIITLSNRHVSNGEISRELGISKRTVRRWIARYEETGDIQRKEGSGRPRSTTPPENQRIVDVIRESPITTARQIASNKLIFIISY